MPRYDAALLPRHLDAIRAGLEAAVLRPTAVYASTRIAGRAVGQFMRDDKGGGPRSPTDTGPLRILTGRAARSLTGGGGSQDAVNEVRIDGGVLTLTKGSRAPGIVHNERRRAKSGASLATLTPATEAELPGIEAFAAKKLGALIARALGGGAE